MFDFGSLKIIGFLVKYRDEIGWGWELISFLQDVEIVVSKST